MAFDIHVTKQLGETRVALDLSVGGGATILFGPSGVGKTSVLNMVAGLMRPDSGFIAVAGQRLFGGGVDLAPRHRHGGYVFQDVRLFPHMRVRANLLYGVPGKSDEPNGFAETLEFLDIGHLLDRWPRTLSGGEAQRVAIGRAVLRRPRFLLLDEPLASIDRARREEIIVAVEHVRDIVGLPILMVTHDRSEAERIATRIIEM